MTSLPERANQVQVATAIGLVVGFLFALFNMATPGMFALGVAELCAVVFFVAPAAVVCRTTDLIGLAETLLLLATWVIFGALVVFGGVDGTGVFWVFTVPFLVFFVKRQRTAWAFSLVFLALTTLYLYVIAPGLPFAYRYTPQQALHFLLALAFYIVVAAAFSHIRALSAAQLQDAKERAEEDVIAKSRFLAAASHDLRQPSHALGMFVARLQQLPHSTETRELLQGVDDSVRALQHMLAEFFDYSRMGLPTMQVRPHDFPLEAVLGPVRDSFSSQAIAKGLQLRVHASKAWAHADQALVQRILINLVANAIQYTERGRVVVVCRPLRQIQALRLEVWDSGLGIAPELQDQVFSEFYQVDNPERDRSKGFGLGLSIVRLACQRGGYPLKLQSRPGFGSRFCITLPLAMTPVAVQGAGLPSAPSAGEGPDTENALQGGKVLFLEDDPLAGAAVHRLLAGWGCEVQTVTNVAEAVQCVQQGFCPDLMISDYRLPGGHDGLEGISMVRAVVGEVPACLVSGDTDPAVRAQAIALGVPLLQKPVRPAKLRAAMRNLMGAASDMQQA